MKGTRKKYERSPVMISSWKKEFIENSAAAFETPKVDDASIEEGKDRYLRIIGDLQILHNASVMDRKILENDKIRVYLHPSREKRSYALHRNQKIH